MRVFTGYKKIQILLDRITSTPYVSLGILQAPRGISHCLPSVKLSPLSGHLLISSIFMNIINEQNFSFVAQTYGTSNCENTVKQTVAKPSLLLIKNLLQ